MSVTFGQTACGYMVLLLPLLFPYNMHIASTYELATGKKRMKVNIPAARAETRVYVFESNCKYSNMFPKQACSPEGD